MTTTAGAGTAGVRSAQFPALGGGSSSSLAGSVLRQSLHSSPTPAALVWLHTSAARLLHGGAAGPATQSL